MQDIMDIVVLRDIILSTCSRCKKVRLQGKDEADPTSWVTLETYIRNASNTTFSHGMCPACMERVTTETICRDRGATARRVLGMRC